MHHGCFGRSQICGNKKQEWRCPVLLLCPDLHSFLMKLLCWDAVSRASRLKGSGTGLSEGGGRKDMGLRIKDETLIAFLRSTEPSTYIYIHTHIYVHLSLTRHICVCIYICIYMYIYFFDCT